MSSTKSKESKVIILGLSQSGKTSIRQVIFEGFAPKSTALNPATVRINRKLFNLAGGNINLFDIGGQSNYLDEVFKQYKERTFSDVKAAIFVVDISDAANIMRSKYYYDLTVNNLDKMSASARVYVFAHKMDVVPLSKREAVLKSLSEIFEIDKHPQASIYPTSIFDDSVWDAMQQVLSYVYPRDDIKSSELKSLVSNYHLTFLAISTSQGLILYSEPEVISGANFTRMKNELTKAFFPGMLLSQAMFTIGTSALFMREIEEDLVLNVTFPTSQIITESEKKFDELCFSVGNLFKKEEFLGIAKSKMKDNLANYLRNGKIKIAEDVDRKFETKISVKCDVCGKQIQKSILDVALQNSEQIEKGIKISAGFGVATVEIFPTHECIEGIREIPVILDNNLE
ncbi:MAG: ADP-ribosylation factor-like protein, partial [Candidatus Thorarchaeota archaeon]